MTLPAHFMTLSDGSLIDTREPGVSPVRNHYIGHSRELASGFAANLRDVKAVLRAGRFTDLGGYPLYFIAADGEALSFGAVRDNFLEVCRAAKFGDPRDGWRVVGIEINYEDGELRCAHTGEPIEAAYVPD